MEVIIRVAARNDMPKLVRLLAADDITGKRELFSDPYFHLLPSV